MTHEEAKALGATRYHQDQDGEIFYFKFDGDDVYQFVDGWLWVDNVADCKDYYDSLKPL